MSTSLTIVSVQELEEMEQEHEDLSRENEQLRDEIKRLQAAQNVGRDEGLLAAAVCVHDTFAKDIEQGYRTKDKEFAVSILGQAITAHRAQNVG